MDLQQMLCATPLHRPRGVPAHSEHLAIVCHSKSVGPLCNDMKSGIVPECNRMVVIDSLDESLGLVGFENAAGRQVQIPVYPFSGLGECINADVAYYNNVFELETLADAAAYIHGAGFGTFYLQVPLDSRTMMATPFVPDYYVRNREKLEAVFSLLADDASRQIFASRIRAILTGNVGYVEMSAYPEYYHPGVRPVEGDVIIDGGISESVEAQLRFLKTIGPTGQLIGCEPDPIGYVRAHEQLCDEHGYQNVWLLPFGLWHQAERVSFCSLGQGSHVTDQPVGPLIECDMTTVHAIVQEAGLQKVDFIKLDVEGAERNALLGALKTIVRHKPKLAISVYHKHEDLFELPLLIKQMEPSYTFYLGHHQPILHETILYAVVE